MGLKLGDLSPLAGMATGKGLIGKLISQGVGGAIPAAIAKDAQKDDRMEQAKRMQAANAAQRMASSAAGQSAEPSASASPRMSSTPVRTTTQMPSKMKSGGMASSASKRADGIATKGKTRGRMC
jgi:hypothetical protein